MKSLFTLLAILTVTFSATAQKHSKHKDNYYMDVHQLEPGSVAYADVAAAHLKDLQTQGTYDVEFQKYWVDEKAGVVYCLSKAKEASDVSTTHEHAHGLVPQEIYEVVSGEEAAYSGNGTLFLDIHDLGPGNVTAEAVEEAHQHDLAVEGKRNVRFINYWVDEEKGKVFCLSEAPSAEAVVETHKEAHGLVPVEVLSVKQGQ